MPNASSFTSPRVAGALIWRWNGPLLMLLTIIGVELSTALAIEPPYPAPIFLLLIVYASMSGGLRIGIITAFMGVLYSYYFFSSPGNPFRYSPDELQRLISNLVVMPTLALLVGTLKLRADRMASGELRESEDRFAATFEQAPVGIAHVDLTGRWMRVNARLCEMLQCTREDLLRGTVGEVLLAEDDSGQPSQFAAVAAGTLPTFTTEQRVVRKDGTIVWANVTVSLVRTRRGTPSYCVLVVGDISKRKAAEEALRQSEDRYRRLFAANPEAMWLYDRVTLRFLEVNDTAVARYGYSRDEFAAMTIRDIRPASEVPRLMEAVQGPNEGTRLAGVWRHRTKGGSELWVDIVSHAIPFDGRDAVLVLATDITERQRAQLALAAEKERLAVTLGSIGDGVITTDVDGRVVLINPAAEHLVAVRRDAALGQSIEDVLPLLEPSSRVRRPNPVTRVLNTGTAVEMSEHCLLLRPDGETRLATCTAAPMGDPDGQLVGVVLVIRDVTERALLEQQLQQAQKMESIGLLAGGIAHDFNNLLTGMIGTAELALMELQPDHPLWEDLQNIKKQGQRGATLTKQLLAFSRRQVLEPKPLDLNQVVQEILSFVGRVIGPHIELSFVPGDRLAAVYADPVQIEQVLLNLCINARDAMPQGGQLMLSTANVTLDEAFCRTHVAARPGDYVQLTVADTGLGMPRETLAHIFEPFFTTKEPGRGTGLGLAMVYGIVRQHNGLLTVDSEPGRGSAFRVLLPVATSLPDVVERILEPHGAQGSETVLVVEDESLVRNLIVRVLRSHGYTVLTAVDGDEALRVFKAHRDSIALVLLDMMLPKLGGRAVCEMLRQQAPDLPVLFVSGYTGSAPEDALVHENGADLLHKPFTQSELLLRVRAVLDRP